MNTDLVTLVLKRQLAEGIDLAWYKGRRILVTGGVAFIGSWLAAALVQLGAEVYIVDNLWRGNLENLRECFEIQVLQANNLNMR